MSSLEYDELEDERSPAPNRTRIQASLPPTGSGALWPRATAPSLGIGLTARATKELSLSARHHARPNPDQMDYALSGGFRVDW